MKKALLILFLLISLSSFCQVDKPYYQSIVAQVNYDTVLYNLQKLQALGVKSPGSAALTNTKNWLISKYQQFGYSDIASSNFTYSGSSLTNLVVTKTGDLYPTTYLIVDGHYDTKTGTGTNDNGSGVAVILEIARLLAGVNTHYSIKFINFSAEEDGLIGSYDYVTNVVSPQNMSILLVFNIDEVGGVAGQKNDTVTCENDQTSPTSNNIVSGLYTDTLSEAVTDYSSLHTKFYHAYGSDYVPFQTAYKIITGLYESTESTYPHTTGDNLAHLDTSYVFQIAKASTGATLYFAQAYDNLTSATAETRNRVVKVFPNPFSDRLFVDNTAGMAYGFVLYDINGKAVMQQQLNSARQSCTDMSRVEAGFYVMNLVDAAGNTIERVKLVK